MTRLHADIRRPLATGEVKRRLAAAGGEVRCLADQFAALLNTERLRYERSIRKAKIQRD